MQSKLNKYLLLNKKDYQLINIDTTQQENEILDNIGNFLNAGADIIELRGNKISSGKFFSIAAKVRELTGVFGALLIIYDRIDIAKLINADGILLDKTTMSIKEGLKLTEGSMLIGFNANNKQEATQAAQEGADYITCSQAINNTDIKAFTVK